MKPKWLIERSVFDQHNGDKACEAAKSLGLEVQIDNYIPFGGNEYKFKFNKNDCVIVYGSIGMVKYVQRAGQGYIPAAWCDWDKLNCSHYLAYLGKFSIHQDYKFLPLAEFLRQKESMFGQFDDDRIFVKPDGNDKNFHGEVISKINLENWEKNLWCYDPPKHSLILVSRYTPIKDEYRLVIANDKFVTGSRYRNDKHEIDMDEFIPQEVINFAENVSSTWKPHPIFCVDVGVTKDGPKLIEIGSINCAGLYVSDMTKMVEAASQIAELEWSVCNE